MITPGFNPHRPGWAGATRCQYLPSTRYPRRCVSILTGPGGPVRRDDGVDPLRGAGQVSILTGPGGPVRRRAQRPHSNLILDQFSKCEHHPGWRNSRPETLM